MNVQSLAVAASVALAASAPPASAQTFDTSVPPGANFETAEFRLWIPEGPTTLRGGLVLVPGSNGDGRDQVEDPTWQALAKKHGLGLVAVHMTDKRHEQMFIEDYVDVKRGSGDALLAALDDLAERSGHPELSHTPLLFWGMSAGGQFNYEFALWKPDRVLAFVVNKGGIYYSAQASADAQKVPGFFFIGETDLGYRNDIIAGIFAINRRAGAHWALAVEPGVAHEVAGSKEMAARFFDEVIPLRLPDTQPPVGAEVTLRTLVYEDGFIADARTREVLPAGEAPRTTYPTSWLPTASLADAWRVLTGGR